MKQKKNKEQKNKKQKVSCFLFQETKKDPPPTKKQRLYIKLFLILLIIDKTKKMFCKNCHILEVPIYTNA